MKNTKKRVMAMVLAFVLAFGMVTPFSGTIGDSNVTWQLDGGVLTIGDTGDMPALPWDASPWGDRAAVTEVIISPGVTSIGESAFSSNNLTDVTIPNKEVKTARTRRHVRLFTDVDIK